MQDDMREPLNVFAVDEKMNRCTGSIPYRSLIWRRKYTEPGDFEMVIPANIYDPSWYMIVCDERPEAGLIQKVEYTDDVQTYDGIDSITISGFFLESILNRIVFLEESPEEQKVYIPAPRRTVYWKNQNPTIYKNASGDYVYENASGNYTNASTGEVVDSADGLTQVDYDAAAGKSYGTNRVEASFSYYTNADKTQITRVNNGGVETTYDILFSDDKGNVFYETSYGAGIAQAVGVVENSGSTYHARIKSWHASPQDVYGHYYTKLVKGPWQRTEMMEPVTVGDSIDIVFKWARRMMGDWILYVEPEIDGIQKSVDPSFQYLGDLLYKTLFEVGASLRLEYSFELNAYYLSVYRGDDRTQDNGIETASAKSALMMASSVPASSPATIGRLPDGYTEVEYIQSTGTQYLDTGISAPTGFSCEITIAFDQIGQMKGIIGSHDVAAPYNRNYLAITVSNGWEIGAFDNATYGAGQITQGTKYDVKFCNVSGNIELVINGTDMNAQQFATSTARSAESVYVLALNYESNTLPVAAKLYGAKVKAGASGEWAVNLVPCVRNSDGAVGMFDTVNNVFLGNIGTGSFIAGNAISYEDVEYIESTGTQYIDTGFYADQDTRAVVDMQLTSPYSSMRGLFGSRDSSSKNAQKMFLVWNSNTNEFRSDYFGTNNTMPGIDETSRIVVDKNKNITTIGNVSVTNTAATGTCANSVMLFCANNVGNPEYFSTMKLFSCKIYDNGVIARDFKPVTRNGEAGLYDQVNGVFYGNSGSGSFTAGNPAAQITYLPNSTDATGSTLPTTGFVGNTVEIAQCGFVVENGTFTGWNTKADGQGTTYLPGAEFILPSGGITLYATWDIEEPPEPEPPSGNAPWAVFSDTWGTLTGYGASRDTSNYKNTCYVLYDYDLPDSFDENGWPQSGFITKTDNAGLLPEVYGIPYTSKRGYNTEHIGDEDDPIIETYLDLRNEKPSCDNAWKRDVYQISVDDMAQRAQDIANAQAALSAPVDGSSDLKSIYEAFEASLNGRGEQHLKDNYYIVNTLDTGLVNAKDYLHGFDLGDLVDMEVSTLGFTQEARIIEVEESYTSGNVDIKLTMGDKTLTNVQKARLA